MLLLGARELMNLLVADASALFALVDGEDPHHAKAMEEARRQRPFVVPSEILGETLAVLQWRRGRAASVAFLEMLRRMPHARVGATRSAVVEQSVLSASRPGPLSYPDWIVVHTCRATGSQPWTFDDDIRRAVKA